MSLHEQFLSLPILLTGKDRKAYTGPQKLLLPEIVAPPERFGELLRQETDSELHQNGISAIQGHEHEGLWENPQAVSYIFWKLDSIPFIDTERILRLQKPHASLRNPVLHNPETMAFIIKTCADVDEWIDRRLRGWNKEPDTAHIRYNETQLVLKEVPHDLLTAGPLRDFLDTRVQFTDHEAFRDIRASLETTTVPGSGHSLRGFFRT